MIRRTHWMQTHGCLWHKCAQVKLVLISPLTWLRNARIEFWFFEWWLRYESTLATICFEMGLALSYYRVMRMWDTDIHVLNACVCLRIAHKEKITSWLQSICFILHVSIVVGHGRVCVYACKYFLHIRWVFVAFVFIFSQASTPLQHLPFFFFFGSNVLSRIFSHKNQKFFYHCFMTMRLTKRRLWTSRERARNHKLTASKINIIINSSCNSLRLFLSHYTVYTLSHGQCHKKIGVQNKRKKEKKLNEKKKKKTNHKTTNSKTEQIVFAFSTKIVCDKFGFDFMGGSHRKIIIIQHTHTPNQMKFIIISNVSNSSLFLKWSLRSLIIPA